MGRSTTTTRSSASRRCRSSPCGSWRVRDAMQILGRTLPRRVWSGGGVGRRDDGCGPILARRLADLSRLRALDCGDRPEDFTADIAREQPDTVVLADAVDMGAPPGSVAWLEETDVRRASDTTGRPSDDAVLGFAGAWFCWAFSPPSSEGFSQFTRRGGVERLVSLFTSRTGRRSSGGSDEGPVQERLCGEMMLGCWRCFLAHPLFLDRGRARTCSPWCSRPRTGPRPRAHVEAGRRFHHATLATWPWLTLRVLPLRLTRCRDPAARRLSSASW
jgi:hypothetical protein